MEKFYFQVRITFVFLFLISGTVFAQGPCSGPPASNTAVASSTLICLGSPLTLSLVNSYNNTGITYQWQYSAASQFGPFSNISGATSSVLSTSTLTGTGYYTALITCTNGNSTIIAVSVYVTIQGPGATATIPYYEGFEGINYPNDLPNCSWSASNLGTSSLTFTTGLSMSGNKHAAFSSSQAGTNYFYTMGLQLSAGVVYSAAVHYNPNSSTPQNWTDLSLLFSSGQSVVNSTVIASVNNFTAAQFSYQKLGGTFTVSSSGVYYIIIRGTNNGSTGSPLMNLDDLSVTIPCTGDGAPNTPTIVINPSSITVCAGGGPVTVTATGAHSYFSSVGNGPVFTFTVNISTSFTIAGTNTLTGCMSYKTLNVIVNPSPTVFVVFNPSSICAGETSMLSVFGANTLYLNGQLVTTPVVVSPSVTTTYTIASLGSGGCVTSSTATLKVNLLPIVSIVASMNPVCKLDETILTAGGAASYVWLPSGTGQTISIKPTGSADYVVIGTDNVGCKNSATLSVDVVICPGIIELLSDKTILYPNPTADKIFLKGNLRINEVQITDAQGGLLKEIRIEKGNDVTVHLDNYSTGIYFIKIFSDEKTRVYKIIKE